MYCIGTFKSGTVSIASWFYKYKSSHEHEISILYNLLLTNNPTKIKEYLLDKDKRLSFDVDSCGLNFLIVPYLIELFPDCKFILTRRNLLKIFDSIINYVNVTPEINNPILMQTFFGKPNINVPKEEEHMMKYYPMYWPIEHIIKTLKKIYHTTLHLTPKEKLLIIDIEDGEMNIQKVAKFLDIDPKSLEYTHDNKKSNYILPSSKLDSEYLKKINFIYDH